MGFTAINRGVGIANPVCAMRVENIRNRTVNLTDTTKGAIACIMLTLWTGDILHVVRANTINYVLMYAQSAVRADLDAIKDHV